MATKFVQSVTTYKGMPADQLALANTEIDLNEIPEGQVRPNLELRKQSLCCYSSKFALCSICHRKVITL